VDLTDCDREPIHVPGAIQPHGALLASDPVSGMITHAAGACEAFFGALPEKLVSAQLGAVIGEAEHMVAADGGAPEYAGAIAAMDGGELDVIAHHSGSRLVMEFERARSPRRSTAEVARVVEHGTRTLLANRSLDGVCAAAAGLFRAITGFDRVMIYRFLADESGEVLAEDKLDELPPFVRHRYPASDIPRQARALYVRNVIRVIPAVAYEPARLVGVADDPEPLDMSDCVLRSVSPIHIQYLKNMGVAASASVSIVRDGALWGLVACHHTFPKGLAWEDRTICRLLAAALSQHIASLEDAELYNERLRARAAEDALLAQNVRSGREQGLEEQISDLMQLIPSTGVAIRRGERLITGGRCPDETPLRQLSDWLRDRTRTGAFATDALSRIYPAGSPLCDVASGVLAVAVPGSEVHQIVWLRAEQVEVINWAGNPHKPVEAEANLLTPRKSFDLWRETVRERSEPWNAVEIETAERLGRSIAEHERVQTLNRLNEILRTALDERDRRLAHTQDLLAEGDHRIRNNLQIIASMLATQLRQTQDEQVRGQLEEALGRVNAVSLLHGRLHRSEHSDIVELEPYLRELIGDLMGSLGREWREQIRVHLAPVAVSAEAAQSIGLVLTELILNAAKYAYRGASGPLEVQLEARSASIRLVVRDWGQGSSEPAKAGGGFGLRIMAALVQQLGGTVERTLAPSGLCVRVTIPQHRPVPQP
jgi:two-component system, chemotaxis family, sensor kinase Cph1